MASEKNLLFISLFLLCAGTAGGWAIADAFAGSEVGITFLYCGFAFVVIAFAAQLLLYFVSKTRLIYKITFSSFLGISLIWFMLCLSLPIYWMPAIAASVKITIFVISVWLFTTNAVEGRRVFRERWSESETKVAKYCICRDAVLDWDKVMEILRPSISVYIPGVSRRLTPILSVLIILVMLLGLNFRKLFPTASVFAWGVASIMMSSCLFQLVAVGVAQALKVSEIEKKLGKRILPKFSS